MKPAYIAAITCIITLGCSLRPGDAPPAAKLPIPATSPATRTAPVRAQLDYRLDLTKPVSAEWSSHKTSATPKGNMPFLGPFCDDEVTLTQADLPPHAYAELSFDLYIMKCWCGEQETEPGRPSIQAGPHVWSLWVVDGQTLLRTTFSTFQTGEPYNYPQSFPDEHGQALHPPFTAAAEKRTLGYTYAFNDTTYRNAPADSVYRIRVFFPHNMPTLKLAFAGLILRDESGRTWGLANLRLRTHTVPPTTTEKALGEAWERIPGDDIKGFDAFWTIVGGGEKAREFLRRVCWLDASDNARLDRVIRNLNSDDYRQRESASAELVGAIAMGEPATRADRTAKLREVLRTTSSPETRQRVQTALEFAKNEERANLLRHRVSRMLDLLGDSTVAQQILHGSDGR